MRLLWMIDSLGPGGAESLMPSLLKELQHQGVDSRVCVLQVREGNPIAAELQKSGIPVDLVPVRNLRNPLDLVRIIRYIRQIRPAVVHTQLEASDVFGTLAAYWLKIPSVTTIHTLETLSPRVRKSWRNWLRWNTLKLFSRRVIVVSDAARQHYLRLKFKDSKLQVLHNGIELDGFRSAHESPPGKAAVFGLPPDSIVASTVAVLREPKGIQYMLQALPRLVAEYPNLYYAIIGEGDYRPCLQDLAQTLGISAHVLFMQYRQDIPKILAASDLFVYPSLNDALPTALLEAQAAGLPIAASRVGGVPEILSDEVNALLFPPANPPELARACRRLLQEPELAQRLASEGCRSVQARFDVKDQARRLISLYREIGAPHEP